MSDSNKFLEEISFESKLLKENEKEVERMIERETKMIDELENEKKKYQNLERNENAKKTISEKASTLLSSSEEERNRISNEIEEIKKKYTEIQLLKQMEKAFSILEELKKVFDELDEKNEKLDEELYEIYVLLSKLKEFPKIYREYEEKIDKKLLKMKKSNIENFRVFLWKKISWGENILTDMKSEEKEELEKYVSLITKIQVTQILVLRISFPDDDDDREIVEVAKILAEIFVKKFRYHFYGNKPTNKIDRPTFLFSFMNKIRSDNVPFISNFVQPILTDKKNSQCELFQKMEADFFDIITNFVNVLNKELVNKIILNLEIIISSEEGSSSELFLKIVNELISFERTVKEENITADDMLTDIFKRKNEIFEEFLNYEFEKIEKKIMEKFEDFTSSSPSLLVGEKYNELKPSKSAHNLIQILSYLNERYKIISESSEIKKKIFERIHCFFLKKYLSFYFESGINLKIESEKEEEIITFSYLINSCLYINLNLKNFSLFSEFIEEMKDFQDQFVIIADKLTRNLIKKIVEKIKFFWINKYNDNTNNIGQFLKEIKKILKIIHLNVQMSRFNKIWRGLCQDLENFFVSMIKVDEKEDDKEFVDDVKFFVESVFIEYTEKPLNFTKKLKKLTFVK